MNYSATTVRSARRFLTASNIDKTDMGDTEIVTAAVAAGWVDPAAPAAPAPAAPAAPALAAPVAPVAAAPVPANTADAVAALLATLTPAAPAFDEAALKAAVEKYANPVAILKVQHMRDSIKVKTTSVKGAHPELARIVKRLGAGMNVYVYGPAGAGKTTLAQQAATSLDLPFYSTGAMLQKYELLGFVDAGGQYQPTEFYKCYSQGGVFLFDEIDASTPMATIPFNAAIENGFCAFPNGTVTAHKDFKVIAAANTNGQGATSNYKRNALDGATLDRFAMIKVSYDEALESRLALESYAEHGGERPEQCTEWVRMVQKTRATAAAKRIDVIVSPRASIRGAAILAMGDSWSQAYEETLGARMSTDQMKQLGALV